MIQMLLYFLKFFVRGHMFDFSPTLINHYSNCQVVENSRVKESNMHLNMDKVAVELIGFTISVCSKANSFKLYFVYKVLHFA